MASFLSEVNGRRGSSGRLTHRMRKNIPTQT
jgi:hypothetical protein